ncbi:hypothetical protein [Pedobacter mucosus]|uniref:hypothetical protein n=1 Tax=Pedobacter mucosus TaxID=2895286 RepID=UPI001EE47CED|nr:hypothetical protein [Pedobacter mucosus]UKT64181.1 hypothetical protein LOK61_00015 [Pedobacter mucosus]
MYRKDLITAEIQKLAQILAKIMGLKIDGDLEESDQLFEDSLLSEFNLVLVDLLEYNKSEFEQYLRNQNFATEKLDLLSQFLFFKLESFQNTSENKDIAERLLQLYNFIELEHHTFSMENLTRQKQVEKFLLS